VEVISERIISKFYPKIMLILRSRDFPSRSYVYNIIEKYFVFAAAIVILFFHFMIFLSGRILQKVKLFHPTTLQRS
jgi:hypothetical protein